MGNKKVIKGITPQDFTEYRKKHYVASATIVVVAGSFDEKKIMDLVKKSFATISTSKKHPKKKTIEKQRQTNLNYNKMFTDEENRGYNVK